MRRSSFFPAVLAGALLTLLVPAQALAVCCPVSINDGFLTTSAQANLIVMDREAGEVVMVPNIAFFGEASDFALLVPTPSVPTFEPVEETLWQEVAQLTLPVQTRRIGDSGCGGSEEILAIGGIEADGRDDGVVILDEQAVGAFLVTVIQADAAVGLVEWLQNNQFGFDEDDEAILQRFVDDDWVFTAMKLDPDHPSVANTTQWNNSVDPVAFRYAATEFELALPVTSINRDANLPMRFYIIDNHRMQLDGFNTVYVNKISRSELESIRDLYPELGKFLEVGDFLTRMNRTFQENDPMDEVLQLEQAPTDGELRRSLGASVGYVPLALLLLGLATTRLLRNARREH